MSLDTAIEAKNVVKKYNDFTALNGVSLEIKKGECVGLLGPNEAGKSTLMKLMYCQSLLTEGELYVLGLNVKKNFREIKSKIGVVPQENMLDEEFTLLENLKLFARYQQMDPATIEEKIFYLLRLFKLEEFANHQIGQLSGGTQRRLCIARALIHSPDLLFLDEPTTGLDPQSRLWLWNFVKQMKEMAGTILMTTHYIEEAEELCDRVAIIDHGKILSIDSPHNLINSQIGNEVVEFHSNSVDLNYYINRLKDNKFDYQVYHNMVLVFIKPNQDSRVLLEIIKSEKVTLRKPTLNDVFLKLAGYNLRDV
ncbi:MAG: ABC transporter ATP-binding protein [Bdellovibrionaceae bacterium]|nr:ABC transporter ATP-binding protein [Pseudobdellovibrionaceae bacterium]